mgnify:CR=1 FL=1
MRGFRSAPAKQKAKNGPKVPANPAGASTALTPAAIKTLLAHPDVLQLARQKIAANVSNPTLVVGDLPALAALGHAAGATVVVDNTFASPWVCRPAEHGADLVVESATKWLGGHSDVIAGVARI